MKTATDAYAGHTCDAYVDAYGGTCDKFSTIVHSACDCSGCACAAPAAAVAPREACSDWGQSASTLRGILYEDANDAVDDATALETALSGDAGCKRVDLREDAVIALDASLVVQRSDTVLIRGAPGQRGRLVAAGEPRVAPRARRDAFRT